MYIYIHEYITYESNTIKHYLFVIILGGFLKYLVVLAPKCSLQIARKAAFRKTKDKKHTLPSEISNLAIHMVRLCFCWLPVFTF